MDQERRHLEESIAQERARLGEATGQLMRLENQLTALIAYGASIFQREAARRQDQSGKKQMILDELSEHLRHRLAAIDSSNQLPADADSAPAGRRNGA